MKAMPRKINPNSLNNLKPGESPGRSMMYDAPKTKHTVTLTPDGWDGVRVVAENQGVSVSEFLEQIGRGQLAVLDADIMNALQDALDLAEAQAAVAQSKADGESPQSWDEVKAELGL